MHLKRCKLMVVMMAAILCLPLSEPMSSALAKVAAKSTTQAIKIRDFTRLSFKWPKPIYLTAESEGDKVIIHFEKPASADILGSINAVSHIVKSHQLSSDGQTLTMTLNGNYRVRSFVSGNVNGVDLLPVSSPTSVAAKTTPQKFPKEMTSKESNLSGFKLLPHQENAKLYPLLKRPSKGAPPEEMLLAKLEPAAAAPVAKKAEPDQPEPKDDALETTDVEKTPPTIESATTTQVEPSKELEKAVDKEQIAASNPVPEKRMTDAEALAQMKKEKANQAQKESDSADADVSHMTDAQAIEFRNKQMRIAEHNATKPSAAPTVKRVDLSSAEQKIADKELEKPTTALAETKTPEREQVEENEKPAVPKVQQKPPESGTARTEEVQTPVTTKDELVEPQKVEEATRPPENTQISVPTSEESATAESKIEVPNAPETAQAKEENLPVETTSASPDAVTTEENGFRVRAGLENEILTMTFPWLERTAAAAFVRDSMAWIVFSTSAKLDLTEVNSLLRAGATITQMPVSGATVLYMPVNIGSGLRVESVNGTFKWVIQLMSARQTSKQPLAVELSTEPPLKPHIFLPLLEASPSVKIVDPIIGDTIDVLPVYSQDIGITPGRNFVDFALLETSQGVAVQRFSDSTEVTIVRNGVRISTEKGATITSGLPLAEDVEKKSEENQTTDVYLPYKSWIPPENTDFMKEIKRLEKTMVSEETKSDLKTHLEIAQLFLAQGYAAEALGYLNNVKRIDPQFYIDKHLSAVHGAANFLLQRYSDAAQDFSVPELKDIKETEFWSDMLAELLGNPNKKFSYEDNYESYIKEYPPIFRQRIGIIAADRAIAAKEYNAALKIFDQMNEHKLIDEVADYINYLMGKIALETQQPADGYKLWNTLLEGHGSEFVKVRTEFSLIIEQMKRNELPEAEAINRLERLAIRWRGDNLELAVLTALSDIYRNNKNWPNAIRISRALNEAFPNTVAAVEAARNMDDAFIAMFDKGETGNLSTLDMLFVYNEYRDLIPQDEVGDRIVDNLTNKMLEMDMLDQASSILEQRMRYRFEHQTRSKVGAKLARIYLMDKKPEQALSALQLSVFGMLPEALLQERTYLTAEALLQLHRYEDLELLLTDDNSDQANAFRLHAVWQQKDWQKVSRLGEEILQNRETPTAPLSDIEADVIVKLALSYVALEENQQISYLRDYFLPLMKGKPNETVFEFLTRPYIKLTTTNFDDVMASLEKTRGFLDQFTSPNSTMASAAPAPTSAAVPVPAN